MNYLERYRNGEHAQVWAELQALGERVRQEPYLADAEAVAAETMRRVRRNCERIVARLNVLGYVFGTYPDGTRRSYAAEPLGAPLAGANDEIDELEEEAGPLPLSLLAFWREVGAVDLVGMHPGWPGGLDPLVVDPPEGALSFLFDEEDDEGAGKFAGLAPDDLHKDNASGGDPYGLRLPNPAADFLLEYEHRGLLFVPYLRLAILEWGGFPGLEDRDQPFPPLDELRAGLEPF